MKSHYQQTRTAILSFLLSLDIHDFNCTAAWNVHLSLTIITVISGFYPQVLRLRRRISECAKHNSLSVVIAPLFLGLF
jgi:hypothetical protein